MKSHTTELPVGLIQSQSEDSAEQNLEKHLVLMKQAAEMGAQIICLQELFLSPYFCQENNDEFFSRAHPIPNDLTQHLAKFAKEHQIVVIGSFFEQDSEKYFNTAAVWDADGSFLGKYRKVHIPDDLANYYSEAYYFQPGDLGIRPFQTKYANIGVQVCWDQWFPEGARSLALQGAQILFYPTAIGWPLEGDPQTGQKEHEAWTTVQRGHAISNTVFVAAANRIGKEDHLNFWGSSFICDPFGKVLKQAGTDEESVLVVPCDLSQIDVVRKDWPFLTCRRQESYQLH